MGSADGWGQYTIVAGSVIVVWRWGSGHTHLMCVQIGNRLIAELRIAHSGLRKGRRDGPNSFAIFARRVSVSNGIHSRSLFGRLDGLTGRSARARDLVRLGKKILGASRETGGWAKAARVVAAAQRDAKRCMNSCDALLCILSVRAESIKLARSGANCRVNSCAALLFLKKKLGGLAQRVAPAAALWSCNQVCSVKKYAFVKVQRWSAVALDFQLWIQPIRLFRLLQGHRAQGIRI